MARKKGGLGRGLAALIPEDQQDEQAKPARPLDVFFGSSDTDNKSAAAPMRGGSARDLLMPAGSSRKGKSARGSAKNGLNGRSSGDQISELSVDDAASLRSDSAEKLASLENSSVSGNASDQETAQDVSRETSEHPSLVTVDGVTFGEIPVDHVRPNRWQPREVFDEELLEELANSIREVGVLQPIVVRRTGDVSPETSEPMYELIMGERRWRATKRGGLDTIPALIRQTDDGDMLRDALLENLHRSQLNPLEEAAAYEQLLTEFNCTHGELSRRIARSRSQISNTIRLLKLPGGVQRRVAAEVLSVGHARALLGLTSESDMEYLADRIVSEGLSVRSTEEIVAIGDVRGAGRRRASSNASRKLPPPLDPQYESAMDNLADALDTRVKIQRGKRRGKIIIEFSDENDLARIEEIIVSH